jgi:DNA-binding transcriptional LysR family regulator
MQVIGILQAELAGNPYEPDTLFFSMANDLDDISVFVAVAETSGFREAGERLLAAVQPALEEMRAAVIAVGELADQPRGLLRLSVASAAESFLRDSTLDGFLAAYPDVRLEIIVDEDDGDIVAAGFDAGVRPGETIDKDMIAIPASAAQRLVVVGSPTYFKRHRPPTPLAGRFVPHAEEFTIETQRARRLCVSMVSSLPSIKENKSCRSARSDRATSRSRHSASDVWE